MHSKFQVSMSYGSKVMAKIKVFCHKVTHSIYGAQHFNMQCFNSWIKNQWVFVKHYSMPPAATKSKKAIFSFEVKVKVTRSLTLVSFERASLVEYACQI